MTGGMMNKLFGIIALVLVVGGIYTDLARAQDVDIVHALDPFAMLNTRVDRSTGLAYTSAPACSLDIDVQGSTTDSSALSKIHPQAVTIDFSLEWIILTAVKGLGIGVINNPDLITTIEAAFSHAFGPFGGGTLSNPNDNVISLMEKGGKHPLPALSFVPLNTGATLIDLLAVAEAGNGDTFNFARSTWRANNPNGEQNQSWFDWLLQQFKRVFVFN